MPEEKQTDDIEKVLSDLKSILKDIFTPIWSEPFTYRSTTIVVMATFDSGQLASLQSLTEVFGPMCLILVLYLSASIRRLLGIWFGNWR